MKLPTRLWPVIVASALLLAGCGIAGLGDDSGSKSASSQATTTATSPPSSSSASGSSTATPSGSAGTAPNDATMRAITGVIQKANDEQQQAFAGHDPTVMKDTATSSYYDELAQNQTDMEQAGVTAIKLLSLEWGPVSVQGTSAQATTYETWQTTYSDGSSDQDRDRNVYTLVQESGSWKIQEDDHPDSNLNQPPGRGSSPGPSPSSPGTSPSTGVPGAVPTPRPGGSTSTDQSENWSGYAATDGLYTGVSGSWTVPQVSGTAGAADATWVGIGGTDSRDLIQAGTDATVLAPGHVRYNAWIETLPQVAQPVPLVVSAGDTVSVSLTKQSGNDWLIAFTNQTTGQHYETTVTYTSSMSSAEWVEEAPSGTGRIAALDDFGTVQIHDATAVKDGKKVSLSQAGAQPITMVNRFGSTVAQPSTLGDDGQSFTVTRVAGTAPTTPAYPGRPSFRGGIPGAGIP